jgi:WD40 repeat protein
MGGNLFVDQTARLWDAASGKDSGYTKDFDAAVLTAVFGPDGSACTTASSARF